MKRKKESWSARFQGEAGNLKEKKARLKDWCAVGKEKQKHSQRIRIEMRRSNRRRG